MPREVAPDDFTDDHINRAFDGVTRLVWSGAGKLPAWVVEEADAFALEPPRADPAELRDHIAHAVFVARGWDDPDDPRTMLHSALKAFYLIKWIERLTHKAHGHRLDLTLAYRVSFAPTFKTDVSIGTPPSKLNPDN